MTKKAVIEIGENYKIEIDSMNHTLYTFDPGGDTVTVGRYKDNVKKARWVEEGHYTNLANALSRIAFLETLNESDESVSLSEYIDTLTSHYEAVKADAILKVNIELE